MTHDILLTGYEPFDTFTINPSALIAQALDGRCLGTDYVVRGAVLPVDCLKMPGRLAALWDEYQPALVIGLGLAFGESGLRIEAVGRNWISIKGGDNGGNVRLGEAIMPGAAETYASTFASRSIVEALVAAGIPAFLSEDAGSHLCNHFLFTALHRVVGRPGQKAPACGFIHLPGLPQMVAAPSGADPKAPPSPSMSLEVMIQAVELALSVAIAAQPAVLRD